MWKRRDGDINGQVGMGGEVAVHGGGREDKTNVCGPRITVIIRKKTKGFKENVSSVTNETVQRTKGSANNVKGIANCIVKFSLGGFGTREKMVTKIVKGLVATACGAS